MDPIWAVYNVRHLWEFCLFLAIWSSMLELYFSDRQLVPVRLIPYLTAWELYPPALVRLLSHKDGYNRVSLDAHRLEPDGTHRPVLVKEWAVIERDLRALEIKHKKLDTVEDERYAIWRNESVNALPTAVFVWLDEFDSVWRLMTAEDRLHIPVEHKGDRDLIATPILPEEMKSEVFRGFHSLLGEQPPEQTLEGFIAEDGPSNQIRRIGASWIIKYEGLTGTIPNRNGMAYITWLISRQGETFFVLDLERAVNPSDVDSLDHTLSGMSAEEIQRQGLTVQYSSDAGEVITQEGISRMKCQLAILREKIQEAKDLGDEVKQGQLESDEDAILAYMSGGTDVRGKPRKAGSEKERKRVAVTNAIARARAEIEKINPALAQHLKVHLRTGDSLTYAPQPPINWSIHTD